MGEGAAPFRGRGRHRRRVLARGHEDERARRRQDEGRLHRNQRRRRRRVGQLLAAAGRLGAAGGRAGGRGGGGGGGGVVRAGGALGQADEPLRSAAAHETLRLRRNFAQRLRDLRIPIDHLERDVVVVAVPWAWEPEGGAGAPSPRRAGRPRAGETGLERGIGAGGVRASRALQRGGQSAQAGPRGADAVPGLRRLPAPDHRLHSRPHVRGPLRLAAAGQVPARGPGPGRGEPEGVPGLHLRRLRRGGGQQGIQRRRGLGGGERVALRLRRPGPGGRRGHQRVAQPLRVVPLQHGLHVLETDPRAGAAEGWPPAQGWPRQIGGQRLRGPRGGAQRRVVGQPARAMQPMLPALEGVRRRRRRLRSRVLRGVFGQHLAAAPLLHAVEVHLEPVGLPRDAQVSAAAHVGAGRGAAVVGDEADGPFVPRRSVRARPELQHNLLAVQRWLLVLLLRRVPRLHTSGKEHRCRRVGVHVQRQVLVVGGLPNGNRL